MKAIILAGGRGERLRPLTDTIPKPMIEVAGKPILEHVITHCKHYGIDQFIITLCYLPEKITSYFGDGKKFGVSITYLFEQQPMGNAGNLISAKKYINDSFIVTTGDSLRDMNIQEMISFHKKKKGIATLNVYKRYGTNPKSMVEFDKDQKITTFVERPQMITNDFVWSNGFFIIFEPDIFGLIEENKHQDIGKDILPMLLSHNHSLYAYPTDGYFIDIGNSDKLKLARKTYKL